MQNADNFRPRLISQSFWQAGLLRLLRPFDARIQALRASLRAGAREKVLNTRSEQLAPYEQCLFSMEGEDGVLKEIFFRIGSGDRYFVEFGAQNGLECNTALFASEYGWRGFLIEGSEADATALAERWKARGDIVTRQSFITAENIVTLFKEAGVPRDFDLLSIDIDGNDYWVWKALEAYRPRVVIIEYNAAFPPPWNWIMAYNPEHTWNGTTYFGASLSALASLGKKLGYALLGTDSHGVNAFFIRGDMLQLSGFAELSPEEAYHLPRYGKLGIPHPAGLGPAVSEE